MAEAIVKVINQKKKESKLDFLTKSDFSPKANYLFDMGSISVTEHCDLSCVFCHFNGPKAVKKFESLKKEYAFKAINELKPKTQLYFAATGELFLDPNAELYIKTALDKDLDVLILTHGQAMDNFRIDRLLNIGLRKFRFSCDAIDHKTYSKIRRGGDFQKILVACEYLRNKKIKFPDINVEINATLLSNTFKNKNQFILFWKNKVDGLNFNAEYYDIFKYRNIHYLPKKRVDCNIQTYLLPSGRIAPCCAMIVYSHENDVSWLPHIKDHSLIDAHKILSQMYEDKSSKLGNLCKNCDWWIMWSRENNRTPYLECHNFNNNIFNKKTKKKLFINYLIRIFRKIINFILQKNDG